MKQWKRLAALSSAIVMAAATLTYFPNDTLQNIRLEISASAETTTEPQVWNEDNLTWTLDANGTLTISGTGTMKDYDYNNNPSPAYNNSNVKKIVIEDGVTSIGKSAFSDCSNLTSITIPNSVTSIGDFAFYYCTSLTTITIPDNVTSIGESAFRFCSSLTSITIPDGVTSIGNAAFSYTGLKSITIPDSVTSIGKFAFYNCTSLTSITIPDGVTSIGESAFLSCSSLTSITIPDSVTSIGESAFYGCSSLTSITIPDSVTSIGNSAFSYCSRLTSIMIPDSVTSIGDYAFRNCSSLKTISLSCGSALKKSDFGNQENLVSYTLHTLKKTAAKAVTCTEDGNKEYWTCEHCGKYFLSDDTNPETATAVELSETVIPASHKLTKVEAKDATCTESGNKEYWTCEHCKKYFLSDDTNPETAKAVELSETVIPASHKLTKVEAKDATCTENGNKEYWTCEHCKKYFLSDDTNPATAKAVEQSEFIIPALNHKNAIIRNASEPNGTNPGYSGDRYCLDCDTVFEKGYTYWNEDNLTWTLYEDGTLNISGTGTMKDYDNGDNRSPVYKNSSVKKVVIEKGVTSIGNFAFSGCRSLTSITIPDNVTSIGTYAFYDCTSLTSITIPDNVTSIGESAFEWCSGLSSVTIPDSVTSIGSGVFDECNNLTVYLESGSTLTSNVLGVDESKIVSYWNEGNLTWKLYEDGKLTISGTGAMKDYNSTDNPSPACNNSNVKKVVIEDGVTSIGKYAFWYCSNLTSITIPDGVTSIGRAAFDNCHSLTSITIPESVTNIEDYAFEWCSSLSNVTIPNSITSIGTGVFHRCISLTSITIPDSVTSIGNSAFERCIGLSSVTIPDSVTSIGESAFERCIGLSSVTIPDSVTSIGNRAFYDCTNLTTISLSCKSSLKKSDFGDQADLVSYTSHTLKKTAAKAATCTESGNKEYWTCEHCGKYFLSDDTNPETAKAVELSETVAPASHKLTKVEAKAATCSENGNKEYWTCEHCGKYFLSDDTNPETAKAVELSETVIPASHKLTKVEAKAVTCAENGNKAYWTCEHCGKYFLSDDANPETAKAVEQSECMIPALNHKNATTRGASEPTETSPGYSGDRYCPDCDKVVEKGYTYWNEDNLTWKLDADGTLTISGTGTMKDYDYNNNPSPANQKKGSVKKVVIKDGVTSIGNFAFYNCKSLTSITIPDSVTSIELAAFNNCNNLTSITIPDSVTSIGDSAFELCNKLSSITLSNNITSIGNWAFHGCPLTSITIPDSVTSIGAMAFYSCSNLQTISLSCKSSLKKSDFGDKANLVSYTNQHFLTKTAAKAKTCTEDGNKEYWTCEHCGKYFLSDDANPETAKTVELSETVIPASHKLTKVEAKDATCTEDGNKEYWTCEHCGKYFLSDDTNPETAKAVEQAETVIPASHKLTKVEAKAATYAENGNKAYWTCEHCKKYFLSDDTNPETAKAVELSETVIPALVQVAAVTTPIKCVYCQDMNKIDLRDYVKNTDVVGEVTVKVATGSTLPDGMKLDGSKLSGKPAKAYEDGKEVTFTFTAENGNTANLTLLFLVAKADPTVEVAVSGDSHTEGDLVGELELILSENSTKGVVELVSEIKALVAGKNTFTWKFTPEDENNYNTITGTVVVNAQTTTTTTTTKPSKTTTTTKATTTTKPNKTTTTKVTTTTKPSKTTTTKVTTTTKPNKTTTTKVTTTTKPNKTTTTNVTTTTKPSKTTTTKVTTTTKPNKTTTTKATTTTKPSKTTTTNATTTTKPNKTTTTNATTTTKPSKTTTTKATTTTKPNKTTTTKATTTTKPNKTTTTKVTTTTKPNKTTTTNATTTTKPSKTTTTKTTTTTNATTTTKPSKTTTTNATTTTKPSKTTTTNATTTTKPSKTTTTNATTTTKPSKTTTTNVTTTTKATTTNTAIPSYGDVNLDGKVDIADAIFLNKYLATLIQFSDAQMANADCCQDGVLNDQDTTALMQFIILLIDDLPTQPNQK